MSDSETPQHEAEQRTPISSGAGHPHGLLESYGLLIEQLESDRGRKAADSMESILNSIEDERLPLETRLLLSRALLSWHDATPRSLKATALRHSFLKIIQVSRYIMIDPDGENLSMTAQRVAKDLALLLSRQLAEDADFSQCIYRDLLKALQYVVDQRIVLAETADGTEAPSLRCDSLRLFMQCLPDEVDTVEELKSVVALLMQVSTMAHQAPLLRGFIAHKIATLRIDDDDVIVPYMASMVDLIKSGHREIFGQLRRRASQLVDYLDDLLENISFDQLQDVLEEVASLDPRKLASHVTALVSAVAREVWEHKLVILGVLLAVAAVSAGVFLPCLLPLGMACLTEPRLYVALFKLLVEAGSHSEQLAMTALQVVAKVARAGLAATPQLQSALLEAINVLKDQCRYCNLFHPDTLAALATCSAANPVAYRNILAWNQGRSARVGDKQRYLATAGEAPTPASATAAGGTAVGSTPRSLRFWGSKKKALVSPSPQSHSLQVAQQVDTLPPPSLAEETQAHTAPPSTTPGSWQSATPSSGDFARLMQPVATPSASLRLSASQSVGNAPRGGGESLADFAVRHAHTSAVDARTAAMASVAMPAVPRERKPMADLLAPLDRVDRPLRLPRGDDVDEEEEDRRESMTGEEEEGVEEGLRPVEAVQCGEEAGGAEQEVAVSKPSLLHGLGWLRSPSKLKVGPDTRTGAVSGPTAGMAVGGGVSAASPTSHSPARTTADTEAEIRALRERIAQLEAVRAP